MRTKVSFLISILTLALILAACGPAGPGNYPANLYVNGIGTVYLTPDIAYINIGVHTENADAAQAVSANNAKAQAVMAALRGKGVEEKDIQTSNFSIWASQQYNPTTGLMAGTVYMVDNTVSVTVRDLATLPDLLDTAIKAGANNINSIQFDVADKTEALKKARQLAVDNAKALAMELAETSGVKLGNIYNISYSESVPTPYYSSMGMGGGGEAKAMPEAPINPGQMQLTVNVSISYFIKQ
jgi:uncharacterized protein YggE